MTNFGGKNEKEPSKKCCTFVFFYIVMLYALKSYTATIIGVHSWRYYGISYLEK